VKYKFKRLASWVKGKPFTRFLGEMPPKPPAKTAEVVFALSRFRVCWHLFRAQILVLKNIFSSIIIPFLNIFDSSITLIVISSAFKISCI